MQPIIFDMDGVLVDTEPLYLQMNQDFFRELGVTISPEEHQGFIGIAATLMWSYIKEKGQLPQSVVTLKALEKDRKYELLQSRDLEPIAGIPELLSNLKSKGHPLALASSSLRKNIQLVLMKTQLHSFFDFIISGEEVANGKPAPDIFLQTAAHFGANPASCIVVEDSANGVKAAKAAGMYCIGYSNPNSGNQDLSLADKIIYEFRRDECSHPVQ